MKTDEQTGADSEPRDTNGTRTHGRCAGRIRRRSGDVCRLCGRLRVLLLSGEVDLWRRRNQLQEQHIVSASCIQLGNGFCNDITPVCIHDVCRRRQHRASQDRPARRININPPNTRTHGGLLTPLHRRFVSCCASVGR